MKTADLPDGIAASEVKTYAETLLESFSPLPLDLLRWGYVVGSSQLFIFAAPADRIAKSQKIPELMQTSNLATCFAAFVFGFDLGEGWSLVKRNAGEFCEYLAVFSENKKWREVYALSLPMQDSDDDAKNKFEKMGVPRDVSMVWEFCLFKNSVFKPAVALLRGGGVEMSKKACDAKFMSSADVRDGATLKAAKKAVFFDRASCALAVLGVFFFAILLFWKISLLFQSSSENRLNQEFELLSPQADLVKNMMDEAIFLQSLNSKKIENVMMIARINKYRPEGVSFAKSVAKSPNSIEIRGKAQSVMLATQFERRLRQSEIFKNIKLAMSGSGSGGTSWTLNAEFKD